MSHETIRFWWNRIGPIFAAEIRKKRTDRIRVFSGGRWHLDKVFVKINGECPYLWRAVDHEGWVLEAFVSKKRDREALRSTGCDRHGSVEVLSFAFLTTGFGWQVVRNAGLALVVIRRPKADRMFFQRFGRLQKPLDAFE